MKRGNEKRVHIGDIWIVPGRVEKCQRNRFKGKQEGKKFRKKRRPERGKRKVEKKPKDEGNKRGRIVKQKSDITLEVIAAADKTVKERKHKNRGNYKKKSGGKNREVPAPVSKMSAPTCRESPVH